MLGILQKLLQLVGLVSIPVPKPGPDIKLIKLPPKPSDPGAASAPKR